eukprot:631576-Ditylum_brightwellii.AAC.1
MELIALEIRLLEREIKIHFVKSICIIAEGFFIDSNDLTSRDAVIAALIETHFDTLLQHSRLTLDGFYEQYKSTHLLANFPPTTLDVLQKACNSLCTCCQEEEESLQQNTVTPCAPAANTTLAVVATTTATATTIITTSPAQVPNHSPFFTQFAYGTKDMIMESAVKRHKEGEPPLSSSPPSSPNPLTPS